MSKSLFLKFPALTLVLAGAVSALSLAPIYLLWVPFITVPIALHVFESATQNSIRCIFWLGFCFGFGYFLAAMHWIGFAFLVNPAQDLWMMPFALAGLASILALFWACAVACALIIHRQGFEIWLSFPICFATFEWLRGNIFTGLPWAVFGQATVGYDALAQGAAFVGMTGLTLMVWLWASAIYAIFKTATQHKIIAFAVLLTLPLAWGLGTWRLAQNPTTYVPDVMIRLVQPNTNQGDKWQAGNARISFNQLLSMTSAPSTTVKLITHIIWPESAIPFLIDESQEGQAELKQHLQPGQTLIAGGIRRDTPTKNANYYTSIFLFDDQGKVINTYDKAHLVPGGEYLPFAQVLEPLGLRKLVALPESFSAGIGPTSLQVPRAGLAGFSICYEAIFPSTLADPDPSNRASWLINVTNDGWFGNSVGPHQHLAQLRLRAIEIGLPAARAANTGISSIIDPLGRLSFASSLGTVGYFDVVLPKPMETTLYARLGDFALLVLLLIVAGLAVILKTKVKRHV